jgi:hypothetical protein
MTHTFRLSQRRKLTLSRPNIGNSCPDDPTGASGTQTAEANDRVIPKIFLPAMSWRPFFDEDLPGRIFCARLRGFSPSGRARFGALGGERFGVKFAGDFRGEVQVKMVGRSRSPSSGAGWARSDRREGWQLSKTT